MVLSQVMSVKASAALDLAVLHPRFPSEEYAGPRFVASLALHDEADQDLQTAGLAGALHLGDGRLTSLFLEIWMQSTDEVRNRVAQIKVLRRTPWVIL